MTTNDIRPSDFTDVRQGNVAIARGRYLPQDLFPEELTEIELKQIITKARMAALTSLTTAPAGTWIFTGQCALLFHGLPTWFSCPDLTMWRADGQIVPHRTSFPSTQVRDVIVPSAKRIVKVGRRLGMKVVGRSGVQTVNLLEAATDVARYEHPLIGMFAMCAVYRYLSGMDLSSVATTDAMAEVTALKASLGRMLTTYQNHRGSRIASSLSEIADPNVAGPGEAFIYWILVCVLHGSPDFDLLQPKYETQIGEKQYSLDFAFPTLKLAFEFTDWPRDEVSQQSHLNFLHTQNALSVEGWRVIYLTSLDMDDLDGTVRMVTTALSKAGAHPHAPSGPLWKPLSPELLDVDRRF